MPEINTQFSKEYLEFRENLNNAQLLNFRAQLKNSLHDGEIARNTLSILQVGGVLSFHIYIDRTDETIWLLGGHWVRSGEPTRTFLERMNFYAAEISQGRRPYRAS
jgi:hypothetical protein